MIQLPKLVAVELFCLEPKVIIAEYAIAVAARLLVAVLSLRAGLHVTHARWQIVLGLYLLFVALTYAVLTAYAIAMARRGNCRDEIADELELEDTTMAIPSRTISPRRKRTSLIPCGSRGLPPLRMSSMRNTR